MVEFTDFYGIIRAQSQGLKTYKMKKGCTRFGN
jgi:hypothetical protein